MLTINKRYANQMINHALDENPNECCGILSGKDQSVLELYRITNSTKSPYRYLMNPQEFLNAELDTERKGLEMLAFYHSHTHSPAYPSSTDVRMALQSGWVSVYYILVSLQSKDKPDIKAFHIGHTGDIIEKQVEFI